MDINENTLRELIRLAKQAVVRESERSPSKRFPDFIGFKSAETVIDDAEAVLGETVL